MAIVMLSKAVKSVIASVGMLGNASEHQEIVETLQNYVDIMKATIKDADELEEPIVIRLFTEIKDVVHDCDDLLDEIRNPTVRFPLPSSKIRQIKSLIDSLKLLYHDIGMCHVNVGHKKVHINHMRKTEKCAFLDEKEMIGREADKETLVALLLSLSHSNSNVSYVTIPGMGGLGKTILARVVYGDRRIQSAFGNFMFWVCVGEDFSVHRVLSEMLHCLELKISDSELPMDELQKQIRDKMQGNNYFLVLDDVWCEDRSKWIVLENFLNVGASGSTILVTTRSYRVAQAIGDSHIHELQSLSDEDSWKLFSKIIFQFDEQQSQHHPDWRWFKSIGMNILEKCGNNPPAIMEVAASLSRLERNERVWKSFMESNYTENLSIMGPLKLSYHRLNPELRNCFEFCAIFPKDYVIEKEVLISMWLALGYFVPSHDAQSMEDIAEEYFSTLLSRCFFQDIAKDEYGQVISFKMHVLLHDLAQKQGGKGFFMLTDTNTNKLHDSIHHLSISQSASSVDLFGKQYAASKTLRSIFNLREYVPCSSRNVSAILSQCKLLRMLDLQGVAIQTLPDTFDQVPNLRYLDLSGNEVLEQLPSSITKLHRLQILRLRGCKSLKELPADMGQLKQLMTLNVAGCDQLASIPAGMNKWSCVHMFTMSIAGGDDFNYGNRVKVKDMKDLVNLKGDILVEVENFSPRNMPNVTEAYILKDASLQDLEITCTGGSNNQGIVHQTLLEIKGYRGTILSSITLSHCSGLQHLTVLSQLRHLKYLRLLRLYNVESIEDVDLTALTSGAMESMIFFPCLERLVLEWMPNLKGWWRDLTWMDMVAGDGCFVDRNGSSIKRVILPMFSCLRDLTIRNCPLMTYFPPCPFVKQLELKGVNETLCMKGSAPQNSAAAESSNSRDLNLCLDKLKVCYNARDFSSLLRKSVVQSAVDIDVKYFKEESLQVAREGFQRCGSSVRHLSIEGFYELKSLSGGGIEHLTDLQSLSIKECFVLDLEEFEVDGEEEEEGMPWKSLRSLSSLTLDDIPKMVNLPKAFQYLTALESLHIKSCSNLEALGDCVQFLTSLKSLHIEDCINLKTLPDCFNSPMFQHIIPDIKNCPELDMLHPNQEISVSE